MSHIQFLSQVKRDWRDDKDLRRSAREFWFVLLLLFFVQVVYNECSIQGLGRRTDLWPERCWKGVGLFIFLFLKNLIWNRSIFFKITYLPIRLVSLLSFPLHPWSSTSLRLQGWLKTFFCIFKFVATFAFSFGVETCTPWVENTPQQIDLAFNIFFMVYFFIRVRFWLHHIFLIFW